MTKNEVRRTWAGINMLGQLPAALQAVPLHGIELRASRERIELIGKAGTITIEQGILEDRAVTINTIRVIGSPAYIMYGTPVVESFRDANELLR